MSSSESATARVVSGVPRVSSGGAFTAFVPQRAENSRAIAISRQLAKVIFFMPASFVRLVFETIVGHTDLWRKDWGRFGSIIPHGSVIEHGW